jgi:RNA polymerase sigma-70 factor (ECF subfamily)
MDEKLLVAGISKGNERVFEAFVKEYQGLIYRLCLRMLRNEKDAEDAAQVAMLKVYTNIRKFAFQSSFSTWVYTLTKNTALDLLRKRKGEVNLQEISALECLVCYRPGPEESAQQKEQKEELEILINSLSKEHRAVLILKDIDGCSYEEIAECLGISLGTVKSRLFRARQKLRVLIKDREARYESKA